MMLLRIKLPTTEMLMMIQLKKKDKRELMQDVNDTGGVSKKVISIK